jgi:hypothetical protein
MSLLLPLPRPIDVSIRGREVPPSIDHLPRYSGSLILAWGSSASGLVDGLRWTAAEVPEKPPGSAGARRPAPARGVVPDMAEHAAEEKDLRRQQLEAREKLGGDARGPLLSRRRRSICDSTQGMDCDSGR